MCHVSINHCIYSNVRKKYLVSITYYTQNVLVIRNVSKI